MQPVHSWHQLLKPGLFAMVVMAQGQHHFRPEYSCGEAGVTSIAALHLEDILLEDGRFHCLISACVELEHLRHVVSCAMF